MERGARRASSFYYPVDAPLAHDERTKVFVVGCPRSGTTWLQLLLEQHPAVASEPETHLFEWYVSPLLRAWEENRDGHPGGLYRLMPEAEFLELIRKFVEGSLEKFLRCNPDAEVIVEKTPWHLAHFEVILRLFPEAHFVHVIRDPRSVAASLKAAHAAGWARTWAPKGAEAAAHRWMRAMRFRDSLAAATPNYREVRYEDLKADAASELAALFDWIGLRATPELCVQAVESCRISKLRGSSSAGLASRFGSKDRTAFYRRGEVASWREELSPGEIRTIEFLAGDLMREMGYECSAAPHSKPLSLRWSQGKRRLRHTVAPYAQALARRLAR